MPPVELDLRGLAPDQPPEREQLADVATADAVVVRGAVPALNAVLTALHKAGRTAEAPVSWEPAADDDSIGLARDLGIGTGGPRQMSLVRDDHGGVLLHHGRIEPASDDPRRMLGRRLGLQAHHDELKVADGLVTRIDVRPEWREVDRIRVIVMTLPLRPTRQSSGRALQVACDPARIIRDGVPYSRPVNRWTWYADDRVRWLLHP
jgi:hypothetical protein